MYKLTGEILADNLAESERYVLLCAYTCTFVFVHMCMHITATIYFLNKRGSATPQGWEALQVCERLRKVTPFAVKTECCQLDMYGITAWDQRSCNTAKAGLGLRTVYMHALHNDCPQMGSGLFLL